MELDLFAPTERYRTGASHCDDRWDEPAPGPSIFTKTLLSRAVKDAEGRSHLAQGKDVPLGFHLEPGLLGASPHGGNGHPTAGAVDPMGFPIAKCFIS